MNRTPQSLLLFILPLFLLMFPGTIFAAGFDLIKFTTTPNTPGANESVLVRMESFAVNLNASNITWYINKEVVKNGIAETSLSVQTGDFGQKTIIDVIIITPEGLTINKQFVIAPAEVDLLWEAQTYTPPFYKGKALPTYKSLVRITAIPRFNATTSDPSQYYYKWTYNRTMGAGEGLGKNSIVVPVGYAGSPLPVNVDVSLPGTDWKGTKYAAIPVTNAKLVLYEQAPLLGIQYHHALWEGASTAGTGFTVHAAPYFFSLDNLYGGNLLYRWGIDGINHPTGLDPLNLTLVKSGNDTEKHEISLTIQNPKRILQSGQAQTTVSFTSQ